MGRLGFGRSALACSPLHDTPGEQGTRELERHVETLVLHERLFKRRQRGGDIATGREQQSTAASRGREGPSQPAEDFGSEEDVGLIGLPDTLTIRLGRGVAQLLISHRRRRTATSRIRRRIRLLRCLSDAASRGQRSDHHEPT